MYIWILLATIMTALSFFNLSPRYDKDNAFSEIKASSLVTRFKTENNAVVKTYKCENIRKLHTNEWDGVGNKIGNRACYKVNFPDVDFGYIKLTDNLPIGYDSEAVGLTVYHYIYCMDRQVEEEGAEVLNECRFGSNVYPTYAVSFAQIPTRWLSKQAFEDADGNALEVEPLPAFVKYLSDETGIGGVAGWTECSVGGCSLKGLESRKANVIVDDEHNVNENLEYGHIDYNSPLWENEDFKTVCRANTPCMFIYKVIPNYDEGTYCTTIVDRGLNPPEPEPEP